jgi:hypothetical protein
VKKMNDTTPGQNAYLIQLALRKFKPGEQNIEELANIRSYASNIPAADNSQIKNCIDVITDCVTSLQRPDIPHLSRNSYPDVAKAHRDACEAADRLRGLLRDAKAK